MDDRRALLEYLPREASELIGYKPISGEEISNSVSEGKIPVWIDDKKDTKSSDEYMEGHFLRFVDRVNEFYSLCWKLAAMERELYGEASTRYNCHVPGHTAIFYEDRGFVVNLTEKEAAKVRAEMERYAEDTNIESLNPPPKP
jgi:hypothetical protein